MIFCDGYYIMQNIEQNQIVISLPQTMQTMTNTVGQVSNRRLTLTDDEEMSLLLTVKCLLEKKGD